jgi:hypothetical protein
MLLQLELAHIALPKRDAHWWPSSHHLRDDTRRDISIPSIYGEGGGEASLCPQASLDRLHILSRHNNTTLKLEALHPLCWDES